MSRLMPTDLSINSTKSIKTDDTKFDPLHYEFDTETIVEPFTYFHDGPVEFRQKSSQLIRSTRPFFSTPEENTSATNSPAIVDSPTISSFRSQNLPKSSPSKLLCRHCKSHNMPEYLYTSHSMYDENGELFCPVLKKCHCVNCSGPVTRKLFQDDEA